MMRRLAVALTVSLIAGACAEPSAPPPRPRLELADVLGGNAPAGFARADAPRAFVFPHDHGAHPEFAAEWWYLTGNLDDASGRRFGYQLAFFRSALLPPGARPERGSAWAADQVWMAHFAVSDVEGGSFRAVERFQRGALGLAGAEAFPLRVWLDDWSVEQRGAEPLAVRLRAAAGAGEVEDGTRIAVDLTLTARKPPVLAGDNGLSEKGPAPGEASYYYSLPRLHSAGTVRIGDREHRVEGSSWLDREWSTAVLGAGIAGWDWFAVQLDDDTELMYYRLRRADGSTAPRSAGVLVAADGTWEPLAAEDFTLQEHGRWRSPIDGASYPSGWTLAVPGRGLVLRIAPLLDNQELDLALRYWEGAVAAEGTGAGGNPVRGRGYVELTGYAVGGSHP